MVNPPVTLVGYGLLVLRRLPAMLTIGLFVRLLVAAPIAAGAWVLHTFLLVVMNEGFAEGDTIWSGVLALSGARLLTGTALWGLAAWLATTLVTRGFTGGFGRLASDLTSVPHWIATTARDAGAAGIAVLAGAYAVGELGGTLLGSRPLALSLFLGGYLALASGPRGTLLTIGRLAWWDAERLLFPGPPRHPFRPERLVVLQVGLAFGLLRAVILPMQPGIGLCGGVTLGFVALVLLALSVRRGPGAALLAFVIVDVALRTALADDGGWEEAGGTVGSWLTSQGAFVAVLHGVPPSVATFAGVMIGSYPELFPPVDLPESPPTKIYGTGTVDDPYRDASAFKIGPDGRITGYPESTDLPPIFGTGTPDDPYTDVEPSAPEGDEPEPPPTEPTEPLTEPTEPPPTEPTEPPPTEPTEPPPTEPTEPPKPTEPPPVAPPPPRPQPPKRSREEQHAQEDKLQSEGKTSWGEFLSNVWSGSKKDAGAVADDVKAAGGWVKDQVKQVGKDVAEAVKDMRDDPQIFIDTVKGTAKDVKAGASAVAETTWEVTKDVVTHPIDIGLKTVTATISDTKKLTVSVAKDVKDMVTDPTRREHLIKNTVGYDNFKNAMDPNVSPTTRVVNYGIGVFKVATIAKTATVGTTRAVVTKAITSVGSAKVVEKVTEAQQTYQALKPVIDALGGGKSVDMNTLKTLAPLLK